ncbi:MAG TPA: glycosyltransferase family 4 protein, partial [Chloroflexota bacterium]|nr:glycosyltransferase family 4 protein [Chloroflexota bacterium]
ELFSAHGHEVTIVAGRGRPLSNPAITFVKIPLLAATHPTQRRFADMLAQGIVPSSFDRVATELRSKLMDVLAQQDVVMVHNASTLHFNLSLTAALCRLSKSTLRDKIVAWTHDIAAINPLYESELSPGCPWDLLQQPQPGVRYVTVSRARRDELLKLWKREGTKVPPDVQVIPNGIDPVTVLGLAPTTAKIVRELGLLDGRIVLLLPVRITRRKNIELAIDVVAALRRQDLRSLLLVTGPTRGHHPARSAEYVAELHQHARRMGVESDVVFLAESVDRPLTGREVMDLYRVSTLLFLPSRSEGFGLPILEAGANRLPVVAADILVFRELADDGARFFSATAKAEEVAAIVARVASKRANRFRATVVDDYAWETLYSRRIYPLLTAMVADKTRIAKRTESGQR